MRKAILVLTALIIGCADQPVFDPMPLIKEASTFIDTAAVSNSKIKTRFFPWNIKKGPLQERLSPMFAADSLIKIRVWLGHELARDKQVVTIFNDKRNWRCELLTYTSKRSAANQTGWYTLEDTVESSCLVTPADGWNKFLTEMQTLKILTMPDSENLPGYNGCGGEDGIDYAFEIATCGRYRFFWYCNPDGYTNKFWQAKNVLDFAHLLETEFGFSYTR